MARRTPDPTLTPQRASRLYRLLTTLGKGGQPRATLKKSLSTNDRGFYRDLKTLRGLGIHIDIASENKKYILLCKLEEALAKLPLPNAGLSVRDAMVLAKGDTEIHRRFRKQLESLIGADTSRGRPTYRTPSV